MQRFEGRTVVVTGGGGGIGGATCRRFASEGARVAVLDLNPEAAEKVAAAIRAEGGRAAAIRCDITDRASVDAAVAATRVQLGPIDVLVNNAGWDVFKPFTKTEPAEWDRLIADQPDRRAAHASRGAARAWSTRKQGRIVNVASDAARVGSSGEAVYAACKGGLVAVLQDDRARARAPRHHGQRGMPGPDRHRAVRRVQGGRRQPREAGGGFRALDPARAASASPTTCPAPSSSSPATTPAYITGQVLSVSGGLTMNG